MIALTGTLEKDTALQVGCVLFYPILNTERSWRRLWGVAPPHFPPIAIFYHLPKYIFSLSFLYIFRHLGYENQDINHCVTRLFVRFRCLTGNLSRLQFAITGLDSNIEESIISSTSFYFSFIKDGDDDVDTPCWIKLDVLPALEQGQGNVTQGKGLLVMSCKKKVTCHVTQAVVSVSLSHFWCPCHCRLFFRRFSLGS